MTLAWNILSEIARHYEMGYLMFEIYPANDRGFWVQGFG